MYHQPPPNVDSTTSIEGMSGALPSKTPVSLLQELCMRRGISPKYDLLQIEGAVHEPTFVYRVTVGEFAANGSGQSKKKAKHAAAKAVLDIIIQGGAAGTGGPASGGPAGAPPELSTQIVSPYDDGIPGNPVGSLQELCMARRWPPPTYELTLEEGFPHERTFSISCTIGTTKEVGTGKSKKLAKRQAAFKMTQRLKDQPVEQPQVNMLADDDDEVNVCGGMRHGSLGVHDSFHNWKRVVNSKRNRIGELTLNIVLEKRKNENAVISEKSYADKNVVPVYGDRYFMNYLSSGSNSESDCDSACSELSENQIDDLIHLFAERNFFPSIEKSEKTKICKQTATAKHSAISYKKESEIGIAGDIRKPVHTRSKSSYFDYHKVQAEGKFNAIGNNRLQNLRVTLRNCDLPASINRANPYISHNSEMYVDNCYCKNCFSMQQKGLMTVHHLDILSSVGNKDIDITDSSSTHMATEEIHDNIESSRHVELSSLSDELSNDTGQERVCMYALRSSPQRKEQGEYSPNETLYEDVFEYEDESDCVKVTVIEELVEECNKPFEQLNDKYEEESSIAAHAYNSLYNQEFVNGKQVTSGRDFLFSRRMNCPTLLQSQTWAVDDINNNFISEDAENIGKLKHIIQDYH